MLGFEPRSEAPQASRIIQCSGPGSVPRSRSYPTRASGIRSRSGARRGVLYKSPGSRRCGRARHFIPDGASRRT